MNTIKTKYKIHGMHCASCEILVQITAKKQTGVFGATVESSDSSLVLETDDSFNAGNLNILLGKHGYKIEEYRENLNTANTQKYSYLQIAKVIAFCAIVYMVISRLGLTQITNNFVTLNFYTALVLGAIASLSTCAATTGVIYLNSLQKVHLSQKNRYTIKFILGRVLGYVLFGFIFGFLATQFTLLLGYINYINLVVALILITLGLESLGLVNIKKLLAKNTSGVFNYLLPPFVLGLLTYFLPCGFTLSAQLYALTTNNPITSAFIMGGFVIGTLPGLLLMGYLQKIQTPTFRTYFNILVGVVMVTIGLITFLNSI